MGWLQNKRPLLLPSPIKALSNQRYRELVEKGYKSLETGDENIPEDMIICVVQ